MILKDAELIVLILSVAQVFATAPLHLRSPEILPRQYGCSSCTTAAKTFSSCRSIECICNPGFVADLQSCFNCAIAANPSQDVISPIQKVVDDYARTCPDVPRITLPPGTAPIQTGTSISVVSLTTSPTTHSISSSSVISQSTGGSGTTPSGTAVGGTKSSAGKANRAGLAAIGAMVGVALVL